MTEHQKPTLRQSNPHFQPKTHQIQHEKYNCDIRGNPSTAGNLRKRNSENEDGVSRSVAADAAFVDLKSTGKLIYSKITVGKKHIMDPRGITDNDDESTTSKSSTSTLAEVTAMPMAVAGPLQMRQNQQEPCALGISSSNTSLRSLLCTSPCTTLNRQVASCWIPPKFMHLHAAKKKQPNLPDKRSTPFQVVSPMTSPPATLVSHQEFLQGPPSSGSFLYKEYYKEDDLDDSQEHSKTNDADRGSKHKRSTLIHSNHDFEARPVMSFQQDPDTPSFLIGKLACRNSSCLLSDHEDHGLLDGVAAVKRNLFKQDDLPEEITAPMAQYRVNKTHALTPTSCDEKAKTFRFVGGTNKNNSNLLDSEDEDESANKNKTETMAPSPSPIRHKHVLKTSSAPELPVFKSPDKATVQRFGSARLPRSRGHSPFQPIQGQEIIPKFEENQATLALQEKHNILLRRAPTPASGIARSASLSSITSPSGFLDSGTGRRRESPSTISSSDSAFGFSPTATAAATPMSLQDMLPQGNIIREEFRPLTPATGPAGFGQWSHFHPSTSDSHLSHTMRQRPTPLRAFSSPPSAFSPPPLRRAAANSLSLRPIVMPTDANGGPHFG